MTTEIETKTYCTFHPNTETSLRCNRCERPICTRCAVLTPTGYRCKDCVRGQQKTFDTSEWYDYPIAFLLGAGLSFLGSLIVPALGFFTIFLAPVAGGLIAEAIRLGIRRRRSKRLFQVGTLATALGASISLLVVVLGALFFLSQGGSAGFGALFPLLWRGVYAFVVTTTVYYRLAGIRL
jgi:hypothetical protein